MKYTEKQIDDLRLRVGKEMSEKRFIHTLGVEKMAAFIGEKIMPESVDRLRAAALLHDISKEYSEAEYLLTFKKHNITLSDEDKQTPALWHSISAPWVIGDEFSNFSDEDILSAVYNHTVGSPDMSIFDEIILLSDYIEEGRKYRGCIELRDSFISELSVAKSIDEAISSLHKAMAISLENTINALEKRGEFCHSRTKATYAWVLAKIKR